MAVTADQLESLSNADLREQCKIFGLPNVPVTDHTRKILIKKLKSAMEGPANGEKEKTKRRETIHVVSKPVAKEPEPEPVKKLDTSRSARRTTIAASSSSVESEPAQKIDRRRSSRYSSTSSEKKPVELSSKIESTKRKTAILEEEDSEDDLILIEAAMGAEKAQKQITPSRTKASSSQESRDRRSRSASLQKSPTVTTSYKKDIPSTVNETEEESGTDNEILTQNVYHYDTAKPFVPTKTERQSYYKAPAINITSSRYSQVGTTLGAAPTKANLTTASTVTSNLSRRYTTGNTYKYDDYEDDNQEEIEIGGETTPYYSDFARRLERLKSEQLNMSGKTKEREMSSKREQFPVTRTYRETRRQTSNSSAEESDIFRGFFMNLDRRYKIKQKLMIILAVFLLLTIYIFIFH